MSNQKQNGGDLREYRVETIQVGNVAVTLRHPILTGEEQKRVEEDIKRAICQLLDAESEEKQQAEEKQSA